MSNQKFAIMALLAFFAVPALLLVWVRWVQFIVAWLGLGSDY